MTAGASSRGSAALSEWLRARASGWTRLGTRLDQVRRKQPIPVTDALELATEYRRIGHDLSLAQEMNAPQSTLRYLANLYAGLHQALSEPGTRPWQDFRRMLREDVPASMQALRGRLAWICLLLFGAAGAGWVLIAANPALISLAASPAMISDVENGRLWTDGLLSVTPPAFLSASIFTNNIVVALTACCAGVLYGLGTFYIIGFNGFMLGAMFAFVGQHHMAGRLFEFIVAHGIVELSTIVVSGAAGMALGEALIRPGLQSRRLAFEGAARSTAGVMLVCIVFLVGAGIIEGYVSPNPAFSLAARIAIGTAYMLLFVAVMTGKAWRRRPTTANARP